MVCKKMYYFTIMYVNAVCSLLIIMIFRESFEDWNDAVCQHVIPLPWGSKKVPLKCSGLPS